MAAMTPEDRQMLADSASTFLGRAHSTDRLRRMRDGGVAFDPAFWAGMAEAGWLGLRLPEDMGGLGLGHDAAALVAGALGEHAVPDPYIGAGLVPSMLLAGVGEGDLAGGLADGRLTVAVMDAETPLAKPGPVPMLAAPPAGPAILFAASGGGARILMVEAEVTPVPRLDGSFGGVLDVTPALLADAQVLAEGQGAAALWSAARDEGALAACACLNGIARKALDLALTHVGQREQFGQKLSEFQVLRHMLVDLRCGLQLAESALNHALGALDGDPTRARLALHAAKASASETAMTTTKVSIQLHGALGFTDEADIGLYAKAAMHWSQAFGTAAAHRRAYLDLSRETGHVA